MQNNQDYEYKAVLSSFFMNKKGLDSFINAVFNNFIELVNQPKLLHTKPDIYKLLMSPNFRGYLVYYNKSIVAYLLGELKTLADGRKVFFINYLFVAPSSRKQGIASKLLNSVNGYVHQNSYDAVMLICDTENPKVYDYYLKRGFMLDLVLRRYERYDVLSLGR